MLPNTLPGAPFPRDVALVRTRRRSSVRQQKGGWCAPDVAHGEPPARRPRVAFPGGLGTQPASRGAALPSQLLPWVVRNCLPLAPPGAFVPSPDTRLRRSRSAPSPFHFLLLTEGGCHSQGGSAGGAPAPPSPPPASQATPRPCSRAPTLRTGRPGPGGRQNRQQQPGQLTWAALVLESPEHQGPLHCHTSTVSAEPAKALQPAGVGKEASSEQGNLGTRGPVPHQESNLAGPHVLLGGNRVPLCSEASVLRGQRDVSVSEASGHRTAGPVCWAVCPAY